MPTDTSHASDGLVYAKTGDGLLLPVIDVSRPPFAVPDDPASNAELRNTFVEWIRKQQRVPRFLTKLMMRLAARRSRLLRTLFQSDQGYLDSITTYIMKLGGNHLPAGFDSPVDRKVADTPHAPLLRLRMQQIAKLLAEALREPLARNPNAPLHLVNIAGGPALDSINALILLNRSDAKLLERPIAIDVMDAQTEGPSFGANALVALQAPGAPLHGLDIAFTHRPYDWNDTAALRSLLEDMRGAVVAASSEGGLFEYGSDDAIVTNLTSLRQGGVAIVAGSVTSGIELRKQMIAQTRFKLYPRGLEGITPLAARADYAVTRSEPALFSDQVLLQPA
ncbi:hypothetical protein [Rhodoplanes sp. Z2-YC6860]|uniref:hypothetical protein n=1 Tax=Rhodoplanes sp. Z2-YC6860 TaxID=674703 RepID=UPI00078D2C4F|nr:hypothetical protein [Rhodoplanes sp. Z2-YC6860]AMN42225.1 hypothetical protein RHPLAN_37930 [Rhodoplanes sp. Z2-YC6860]